MASIISQRLVNAFERFNADLDTFRNETGEDFAPLYEDSTTLRQVKNFRLYKNGKLTWEEKEMVWDRALGGYNYAPTHNTEQMEDDDEAREWLSFWRANLRRAKRYWSMDTEKLDKIQDGEIEDEEE